MRKHDQSSVAAEGARRATGAAAARDRKGRCSTRCKRATVLRLLRGEDLESVSRELGITAARASQWRDRFVAAGQARLEEPSDRGGGRRPPAAAGQDRRTPDGDRVAVCEGRPAGGRPPFGPPEVDAMSGAQSISTRRAYGVQRVCRVWARPRSSVYALPTPTAHRRRSTKAGASTPATLDALGGVGVVIAPLNEGRSVNPGYTCAPGCARSRPSAPLNEGRSVNPGYT